MVRESNCKILANMMGEKWYLGGFFYFYFCTSLMMNEVEHLFQCLKVFFCELSIHTFTWFYFSFYVVGIFLIVF